MKHIKKIIAVIIVAVIGFQVFSQFNSNTMGVAQEDKILNLSVASEPIMDPAFVTDSYSMPMIKNIFEGLARVNAKLDSAIIAR